MHNNILNSRHFTFSVFIMKIYNMIINYKSLTNTNIIILVVKLCLFT